MNDINSNSKNDAQDAYPEQGHLSTAHDKQTTFNQDTAFEETISALNKGAAQERKSSMSETTNGDQGPLTLEYKVPTLFGRPPTRQAIQAYKNAINELFPGAGSFTLISPQLEGVACIFRKAKFRKEFAVVDSIATAEEVCRVSKSAIVIIHEPGSHKKIDTDARRCVGIEFGDAISRRMERKDVYLFRDMCLIRLAGCGWTNVIWRV